jgi:poly(3-hydroxybutyrate) depolymerase
MDRFRVDLLGMSAGARLAWALVAIAIVWAAVAAAVLG